MARRIDRGALRLADARVTTARRWENLVGCACRPSFRQRCLASTALVGLILVGGMTEASLANPTGGNVVAGSATISQPSSTVTNINQTSTNTIIDWTSFSIGRGERTQFYQPGINSWALNRVTGGDPSRIAGQLIANGNIAIVNRSGIVFAQGSQVDVNSLIATTADIHNQDFMAGKLNFNIPTSNPNATVTNAGQISVGDHGLAALVGPGVANSGVIQAKLGTVVLGGAQTFTVDFYGDGLISFDVGSKVAQAPLGPDGKPLPLVSNTGQIFADGGTILLTADAVDNIVTNMVEAGGTLQAQTIGASTGNILIDGGTSAGGTVLATGTIDASGYDAGATGGSVAVLGDRVGVMTGASIDVSGDAGGGTVLIGGNFHGAGPQQNASLTLVQQGASIKADAITSGNGGKVAVWSNQATGVHGAISARGGALGGNGGMIETSSHGYLDTAGVQIDTSALRGSAGLWLLDPDTLTITNATSANDPNAGTFAQPFASNDGNPSTLNVTDLQNALTNGNVLVQTTTGDIDVAATVTNTTNNNLGLNSGGSIVIGNNTAAVNIDFSGSTAGSLFMNAAGSIGNTGKAGTILMGGGSLQLAAGTGIGTGAGGPLVTTGVTALAATTTAGAISLTNSGSDVTVTQIAVSTAGNIVADTKNAGAPFNTVTGLTAATGITLQNTGNVTLNQAVSTPAGPISVQASGNLTVSTAVGGSGVTTPTTGTIALGAGATTGTLTIASIAGGVGSLGADTVTLTGQTINISGQVASHTSVNANGQAISVNGGVVGDTGGVALVATTPGHTGNVTIAAASFVASSSGPILLQSDGAVNVGGSIGAASGGASLATGTITLTADSAQTGTAGTLTITGGVGSNKAGAVSLSGQQINIGGGVDGSSSLTIAPSTAASSIGIGDGAAGTFALSNASLQNLGSSGSLNSIATDFKSVTIGNSKGAGAVTVNSGGKTPTLAFATQLTIQSPVAGGMIAVATALSSSQGLSLLAGGGVGTGISVNAAVTTTGAANLNLTTTAGDAGDIVIGATGSVDSGSGAIALSADRNLTVTAGGLVGAATTGTVTLSADSAATGVAGTLSIGGKVGSAAAGNINLSGQQIDISAVGAEVAGQGTLTIAPSTAGSSIAIGDGAAGTFALTNASLQNIGSGGSLNSIGTGFKSLTIGSAKGTGAVTINSTTKAGTTPTLVFASPLTILSPAAATGTISVNSPLTDTGGGLTLLSGGGLTVAQPLTAAADIGLVANTGDIVLTQAVTSNNGNVLLAALTGAVTETGGSVSANAGAGGLLVQAGTVVDMQGANDVGTLAADASGGIALNNIASALAIGTVNVAPPDTTPSVFATLTIPGTTFAGSTFSMSGVAAGGDSALVSTGTLSVIGNVNVGANRLFLRSTGGDVRENGPAVPGVADSGLITAQQLLVEAAGQIDLEQPNQVATLAGRYGTNVAFEDASALTIGSITMNAPSLNPGTIAGFGDGTGTGDVALVSRGALTLSSAVNVGVTNNLVLESLNSVVNPPGSPITAGGLVIVAQGDETFTGNFARIGAEITNGGFTYIGSTAFQTGVSLNLPSNLPGIAKNQSFGVTADNDIGLVSTGGSITLAQNVISNHGNVLLAAVTGAVTEVGGSVSANGGAGGLLVQAGTAIDMQGANDIQTLAANAGGGIAFSDAVAANLTIGTVSVAPPDFVAPATPVLPTLNIPGATFAAGSFTMSGVAAGGDAGLAAGGNITLAGNVTGANVGLNAGGFVLENGGIVNANGGAGNLIVRAGTTIDMQAANRVAVLAAVAGQGVAFFDAANLTVGTNVAVNPPSLGDTLSDVTAGADSALVSAGALTLTGKVNVGAHNLLIGWSGGTATAPVSTNITANGVFFQTDQDLALNNWGEFNQIGANITGAGHGFSYVQLNGFTVGAVNPPSPGFAGATADRDIALVSTAGSVTLAQNVTSNHGNVLLSAPTGAVTESGAGAVLAGGGAGNLIVRAGTTIDLQGSNEVGALAALAGGGIAFFDVNGLTIDTAIVNAPGLFDLLSNVSAGGDIGLASGGNITLVSNVTGANVGLNAATFVLETGGGFVTANGGAGNLVVRAGTIIDMQDANDVGTLAAVAGQGIAFFDQLSTLPQGFVVGTNVAVNPPSLADLLSNVSAGGDVGLQTGPGVGITLVGNVVGPNVGLNAGGSVTEAGGIVDANNGAGNLIARAGTTIDMQGANEVGTLAALAGGGIAFNNATALTVGTNVVVNPPSLADLLSNVSASGDVGLQTAPGLNITLVGNVIGPNVSLNAGGSVAEAGGTVNANNGAGNLIVRAGATIDMQGANEVGTLAALAGGGIAFFDQISILPQGFVVGTSVAVNPPSFGGTLSNVTAGADIGLQTSLGVGITLAGNVIGANVGLNAGSFVFENGGIVNANTGAGNLIVRAGTTIDMQGANEVGTLAALAGGGLAFNDAVNLTIGTNVAVNPPSFGDNLSNVTANAGDVGLASSNNITLVGSVVGPNVGLRAAGSVTEAGGFVNANNGAGNLIVRAGTTIALQGANQVRTFAALAGGGVAFFDDVNLTVGANVTVNPPSLNDTLSNVTAGGDIGLASGGNITLIGNVTGANVGLNVGGSVTEAGGIVNANNGAGNLIVRAVTTIDMQGANQVGTLAALGGGIAFFDEANLTVGTNVAVNPPPTLPTLADRMSNVTALGGDVGLGSAGNITLVGNVTGVNVGLNAGGSVAETGGIVNANNGAGNLIVRAGTTIDMQGANDVGTLAALAGGIAFNDAANLTVGTNVAVNPPSLNDNLSNVTAGGDIGLSSAGNLTLVGNVIGPNVGLNAAGSVTEAGGIVDANNGAGSLIVRAGTTIDMQDANRVAVLAANAGQGIAFSDAMALTVGTNVAVNPPSLADLLSNVTAGGDIGLQTAAGLGITLVGNVVGPNVGLNAGSFVFENGGIVNANNGAGNLIVRAVTTIDMQAANEIGTLAAVAGQGIAFNDAVNLTVGTNVAVNPPSLAGLLSNVTAGADIGLASSGNITLVGNVIGPNVGLNAGGSAAEAGGIVNANGGAGNLIVRAGTAIDMQGANLVAVLAANAGQGIAFLDAASLTVGTNVPVIPPSLVDLLSNVTAGGDIELASSANLTLVGNVVGANVGLNASASVTEAGGIANAKAGAGNLSVRAGTIITMQDNNAVGTLAAVAGGGITFADATALTVAGAAVPAVVTPPSSVGVLPLPTTDVIAGGDTTLASAGRLTLAGNVTSVGRTVTLKAGGAITQSGGVITANTLTGTAGLGASMNDANQVANFGSFTTTGGDLSFTDAMSFVTTGTLSASRSVLLTGTGDISLSGSISATSGNVAVTGTGDISLSGSISATSGNVAVTSNGNITESGSVSANSGNVVLSTTGPGPSPGTIILSGNMSAGNIMSVAAKGALRVTPSLLTLTAGTLVQLGGSSFVIQSGELRVTAPALQIVSRPGGVAESDFAKAQGIVTATQGQMVLLDQVFPVTFGTVDLGNSLSAAGTQVLISVGSGTITGHLDVGALAIDGSSANLTGTIAGVGGPAAAGLGSHSPNPNNANQFNNCAVGTVNCIVLPQVVPFVVTPINVIDLLEAQPPSDPIDIDRLNTGSEDSL